MNEIKLIEEIEDAIHNTKYDELLYKIELKLKIKRDLSFMMM